MQALEAHFFPLVDAKPGLNHVWVDERLWVEISSTFPFPFKQNFKMKFPMMQRTRSLSDHFSLSPILHTFFIHLNTHNHPSNASIGWWVRVLSITPFLYSIVQCTENINNKKTIKYRHFWNFHNCEISWTESQNGIFLARVVAATATPHNIYARAGAMYCRAHFSSQ